MTLVQCFISFHQTINLWMSSILWNGMKWNKMFSDNGKAQSSVPPSTNTTTECIWPIRLYCSQFKVSCICHCQGFIYQTLMVVDVRHAELWRAWWNETKLLSKMKMETKWNAGLVSYCECIFTLSLGSYLIMSVWPAYMVPMKWLWQWCSWYSHLLLGH